MRDRSDRDLRVVLVEDDPLTREVLSAALAGTGFEVHAGADGTYVEHAATAFRPDIALSDLRRTWSPTRASRPPLPGRRESWCPPIGWETPGSGRSPMTVPASPLKTGSG